MQLNDLAADMHVDACDPHARQFSRMPIDRAGTADRNAELVFGFAGRDLGVGSGVHIRIDPQRDRDAAALARRDRGEQFKLGFGFNVYAQDAGVDGGRKLAFGLADAGEHDLPRRNARRESPRQFPSRHHVGAGAEPCQRCDHRLVGICLHGVAHERPHVREGASENLVMPRQGGGGIAVERRADLGRNAVERNVFGVKHASAISEVVHGAVGKRWRQRCV